MADQGAQRPSPDLLALKRFLSAAGMDDTADIFTSKIGIPSIAVLRMAVTDTEPGGVADQLRDALRDSGALFAVRRFEENLTVEAIDAAIARERAAAIAAAGQPSAETAAARQKALADAIARVEGLRSDLAAANQEVYDQRRTELRQAHNDIVGRLADFQLDFAAAETPASRELMDRLFRRTIDDLQRTSDQFAAIPAEPRSLTDTIVRGDMLRGFLLTPVRIRMARADLARMPDITTALHRDPGAFRQETLTFKTESTNSFAAASAAQLGSNLAVSAQASGGGFVGAGIAALSTAASVVDQHIAGEESTRFETAAVAASGEIHSIYDPRDQLRFQDVRLGDAALDRLRQLHDIADPARQRAAAARFLDDFGSHYFREVTLGGRYQFEAIGRSFESRERGSLQTAVSRARNWAVSASASFRGISGAATGTTSVISDEEERTASLTSFSIHASGVRIEVKTEVLGGLQSVPRDIWTASLQYNSTWRVIGRAEPVAVWELLDESRDLPPELRAIAPLLEQVWVQDIFPGGAVSDRYPGLAGILRARDIRTAAALAALLEEFGDALPVPPVEVVVETADSGDWVRGGARAHAGRAGLAWKLIGGGAREEHRGRAGALLTGSYPYGSEWVAQAVEHGAPEDVKVTAYALYLHDPDDLWEVRIVEATSSGEPQPMATVTAVLPEGFVLTGGGARAEGPGANPRRLLTRSHPAPDRRGWIAECKDHVIAAPGHVTAWAIGIRPRNGAEPPPVVVATHAAAGNHPVAERSSSEPNTFLGGGAGVAWDGPGGLLTASYPDIANNRWIARAKDHLVPDRLTLTVYTLALPTT